MDQMNTVLLNAKLACDLMLYHEFHNITPLHNSCDFGGFTS